MKIGIIGTRGIPNNYGGFEQFAEYLSKGLAELGHDVTVYTSHDHPYQEKNWNNVSLCHILNPEKRTGTWGQFIYDLLCIIDSRKKKFDIILQLGYTSNSIWGKLLPKKSIIITNMDGLEWKRTKYSKKVQRFIKYAESLAVKTSDYFIADSIGIQTYLKKEYNKVSEYIPYGTNTFENPNPEIICSYNIEPFNYNMLIARMEPENNVETILDGVCESSILKPFLVIGNTSNTFGKYLRQKFSGEERIRFLGSLYDIEVLNNLRHFSCLYFHGHSVGGTNPSLLEAMASQAVICAHRNEFNHYILNKDAYFFSDKREVALCINTYAKRDASHPFIETNMSKVKSLYLWPKIIKDYEAYFKDCIRP